MPDKLLTARSSGSGDVRLTKTILDIYSREILLAVTPLYIYDQFSVMKTELMRMPGLGVNFISYTDLDGGGQLSETESIQTNSYSESITEIAVGEWGNGVMVSELLLRSSFDDIMDTVVQLLARNNQKVTDNAIKTLVANASAIAYAPDMLTGKAIASRATINQNSTFSGRLVKDVVEVLDTQDAPRFNNDYLVGIVSPHQMRDLKDDDHWLKAQEYVGSNALFTGEQGQLEGVRFVQTNQQSYIPTATAGTAATDTWDGAVYQGVVIGANAYGHAKSLPVEMREAGVIDFGRKRAIAWYSIEGYDFIYEDSIILLETA